MQYPLAARQGGNASLLNIAAAGAVVKATPGTIWSVHMTTANTVAGGIYDCATVGAAAAANLIAVIPVGAVGDIIRGPFPCQTGIVVIPGTSGVASAGYN